jgi:hypothetical protein
MSACTVSLDALFIAYGGLNPKNMGALTGQSQANQPQQRPP